MKKLISGLSALAIAAAIAPMSAFAENETGGSTNVTFDAPRNSPEYMITIPAKADLNAENPKATIKAENVYLDTTKHKQINVTLDSAQYVETGASTFIAKTEDGSSSVTYTIGKGDATTGVKVGDTVAEFTADGDQVLSFSEPTGATFAGTHTETLTFGIEVEKASNNPYAANNVGDTVTFGSYDWYIIGKSDNGVTLLMKENLTTKGYNDSYASVTWETCSLRTYLNGEFYNGSGFSDDDRAKIVKTSITNPNNPGYGTNGGNATEDYIYLLSIAEANALDSSIRNIGSSWWLRSPGSDSHFAAFVNGGGDVLTNGGNLSLNRGVRPVVNLKF